MTSNLNILIIGKVKFTESMVSEFIKKKIKISGIICGEEKGINSDFVDLSIIAEGNEIPFLKTKDINSKLVLDWASDLEPDIIFCLGWPQLIKKDLLSLPAKYVIGYHPSDLPTNRGRHSLIWAMVLGLTKTASSFFVMDEGADTGRVISKKSVEISENDKAKDLYANIEITARVQIIELVKMIQNNQVETIQGNASGNSWRKRSEKDGEIDWRMTAISIQNLIRALSEPYDGAHFCFNSKQYKVFDSELSKRDTNRNIEPGKIISINKGLIEIQCGAGSIILKNIEPLIDLTGIEYL